jgi:hypothetical protein
LSTEESEITDPLKNATIRQEKTIMLLNTIGGNNNLYRNFLHTKVKRGVRNIR